MGSENTCNQPCHPLNTSAVINHGETTPFCSQGKFYVDFDGAIGYGKSVMMNELIATFANNQTGRNQPA